ncbi:MAG: flagellar basal body P-ring protein FlgI, partial [Dongiaceae bacterium]
MAHMLSARMKMRRGRTAVAALVAALTLSALAPLARADDSVAPRMAAASEQGMLVGVGVVIGLPGTGDSAIDANAIDSSIVGVLKRAGLEPWRDQIKPGRIAVVILSAQLPDGARDGTQIAVSVSAIGDARSIAGGTLLVTPLRDADGT